VSANADTDSHTFSYRNCNSDPHSNSEADTDSENCSNAKVSAYPSAAPVAALKETASSDS